MKNIIKTSSLFFSLLLAESAFSADLVCDVYSRGDTNNGIKNCSAFDFTFGSRTGGKFYLKNISKPILRVIWEGDAKCDGGTECRVTVNAYSATSASAIILYKDGTFESTNTSEMSYETGH